MNAVRGATASVAATTGTATDPSDAFRREIDGVFVRRRSKTASNESSRWFFYGKSCIICMGFIYLHVFCCKRPREWGTWSGGKRKETKSMHNNF